MEITFCAKTVYKGKELGDASSALEGECFVLNVVVGFTSFYLCIESKSGKLLTLNPLGYGRMEW